MKNKIYVLEENYGIETYNEANTDYGYYTIGAFLDINDAKTAIVKKLKEEKKCLEKYTKEKWEIKMDDYSMIETFKAYLQNSKTKEIKTALEVFPIPFCTSKNDEPYREILEK